MNNRWNMVKIQPNQPVEAIPIPIVGDAAVANVNVADGRLIPLFLIDCSNRPDVEDAIKIHRNSGMGDVTSNWAMRSRNADTIGLLLSFTKPSVFIALLEFDIVSSGGLIDSIILAQGLYLQCGKAGDRFKDNMDKDRILVEVPSKEFQIEWDKIYHQKIENYYRKQGIKRREAKVMARQAIESWRDLIKIRLKRS